MMSSLSLQVSALLGFLRHVLNQYMKKEHVLRAEMLFIVIYGLSFGVTFSLVRLLMKRILNEEDSALSLLVLYPGSGLSFHFLFPYAKTLLKGVSHHFKDVSFKMMIPFLALQSQNRFHLVEMLLYPVFKWLGGLCVISLVVLPSSQVVIELFLKCMVNLLSWQVLRRFQLVGHIGPFMMVVLLVTIYLRKKHLSLVVVLLMVISLVFPMRTQVVYLDVGQGDATLIQSSLNSFTTLIDTGSKRSYKQLKRKLHYYGVSVIDQLVITHEDEDHDGSIDCLKKDFIVKAIIYEYDDLSLLTGFPLNHDYGDTNANSLLMGLKIKETQFLFTGDAGIDQEQELIRQYPHLKVDVLKLGHHGSKTSTSKSLLQSIEAKYGIASSNPKIYGHPHIEVKRHLHQQRVKLLNTHDEGDIRFVFTILLDYLHTQARGFAII